jgi:hypothetical protein
METGTSVAESAPGQALTSSEIERAKLHLWQTRCGVVGAIKGLSEPQWGFKPAVDCWSIAEVAEHIAFVQERVLGLLQGPLLTAPLAPAGRDCQQIDAVIINQIPNRLAKFPAPEPSRPSGGRPLSEALHRVEANTTKLSECLDSMPELRHRVLESAPLKAISKGEYQVMDGYQWILAASAHTERHTKQILEVRADPNFPAA